MSLQRRRERYILIHTYKIVNRLAPNDLNMQFYHNERRGSCCTIPAVIKSSKAKYQSLYDHSFHVIAAKLWNLIPKEIKSKPSINSFKNTLTRFISEIPDQPPIQGMPSNNSLLDLLQSPWRSNCSGGRAELLIESSTSDDELPDGLLML